MTDKKIVMLAGGGESTVFMYNGLKHEFSIERVIIEEGTGLKKFLKRRIKRLGLWKVFGQVLFQGICAPLIRKGSRQRIAEIKAAYKLSSEGISEQKRLHVTSVNSDTSLKTLKEINPDVIIVNGTRIISKKILNGVSAPFINTHVGITPKYRGVHGGYWALANEDPENCGVTVHLVDAGIDTGNILYQGIIKPESKDNFSTYTYMQLGEGVKLMKKAVKDALNDAIKPQKSKTQESHLWYHPTIWYYLKKRIFKGVK